MVLGGRCKWRGSNSPEHGIVLSSAEGLEQGRRGARGAEEQGGQRSKGGGRGAEEQGAERHWGKGSRGAGCLKGLRAQCGQHHQTDVTTHEPAVTASPLLHNSDKVPIQAARVQWGLQCGIVM